MLSTSGATAETLDRFYADLRGYSASPLWLVQEEALVAEPKSRAWPHRWRWRELRPQALRAGDLIGTADAERRVLMLLNPGLERMATTNSMFAGLQIVMPGEAARAHRHTPAALRFIIESQGGSTTVNGDRIPMYPGDLVLTPNWTWHDHANDTAGSDHLAGWFGYSAGADAGGGLLRTLSRGCAAGHPTAGLRRRPATAPGRCARRGKAAGRPIRRCCATRGGKPGKRWNGWRRRWPAAPMMG